MNKMVSINADRLWDRLHKIGAIGADPRGGISRFAWEPAYKQAVELLCAWAREEGLTVRIDTVGNVFARLEGTDPDAAAVLSGSHLDTVPQGGYFDGLAGVMGALEALSSIRAGAYRPRRPLEMVAIINEEASQYLGGTFSSTALKGGTRRDSE